MSLLEACQKQDINQIKYLIEQNNELINQLDEQGRTVLHYCSDHQTIDCINLIINKSTLNLQDIEGYTALHLACINGNKILVKYLCEQGADVTLVDNEYHSLIHWITVCGHIHLFDILIQHHTPVHTADSYGAYPIHYALQLCTNNNDDHGKKGLEILKKLIENNVDVNCLDQQKRTPFIWAASAGAIDALRVLYKAGANPLHVDKDSLSALHCAATGGHANCIRILVDFYGCSVESEDINGCTPVFYAITFEHSKACQILLDLKANPNHQDNRERTPSHCAALKGNVDCLRRLIKANGDIWIKNKRGDYPIHEAINAIGYSKLKEASEDLLKLENGCLDVIRYIFELYPEKINIKNNDQRTPLHLAASLGNIQMCKVLMECGAKINSFIQTSAGNFLTPYDLARIRHQDPCAEYLVSNHGGQRGNLLAQIYARRIQKYFHRYKSRKTSTNNHHRKLVPKMTQVKSSSIKHSTNNLLNQAKICLDNKKFDDSLKIHSQNSEKYLIDSSKDEQEVTAIKRREMFAKSKSSINQGGVDYDIIPPEKIIIHTSNSISTSVKLYERHKLIAEELFKIRQARIRNNYIVIGRPLYKILIENAFNPHNRDIDEIEKYLETLIKAYDVELEAIRKRTKSTSPRRISKNIERITKTNSTRKNQNHD